MYQSGKKTEELSNKGSIYRGVGRGKGHQQRIENGPRQRAWERLMMGIEPKTTPSFRSCSLGVRGSHRERKPKHEYLAFCHTAIYNKKCVFHLHPRFQHRDPKTPGIS